MDITAMQQQIQADLAEMLGPDAARDLTGAVLAVSAADGALANLCQLVTIGVVPLQAVIPDMRDAAIGVFVQVLLVLSQLGLNDEGILIKFQETRDKNMQSYRETKNRNN